MKRLFLALCFISFLGMTTVLASDVKVSPSILESFQTSFTNANNAVWTEVNGMYRVEFTEGSQHNFAYYSASGELIVVSKQIGMDKLPTALQQDYQSRFSGYAVVDIYQFNSNEKTDYYLVIENAEKQITLHAAAKKWRSFQVHNKS
ncbi:MAG: hypothetical protein ACJ75B_13470 [Flavisolibacter sp.]